jgi:hypothetical protein
VTIEVVVLAVAAQQAPEPHHVLPNLHRLDRYAALAVVAVLRVGRLDAALRAAGLDALGVEAFGAALAGALAGAALAAGALGAFAAGALGVEASLARRVAHARCAGLNSTTFVERAAMSILLGDHLSSSGPGR